MKHTLLMREKNKKTQQEQRKRKATLDSIKELKDKKKIKLDTDSLLKSTDELIEKAESTGKMTFVTQSSSFWRTAKGNKTCHRDRIPRQTAPCPSHIKL